MGTNRKRLPAGDDRALFVLSQGRCYAPGCAVPAFKKVNGHYKPQLRRAHICAHSPGGARYDPTMSQDERDSWLNMLLLCDPHHDEVDSISKVAQFPVALLRKWKQDREQGRIGDDPKLSGISDLDLQQMLLQHVEGILNSIDKLEGVSREVIDEIKGLLERQFVSPRLDTDAIDLLYGAVMSLRNMAFSDDVSLLYSATDDLKVMGIGSQATRLLDAAEALAPLQRLDVDSFTQVFRDLDRAADRVTEQVRSLDHSAQTLQDADEQIMAGLPASHQTGWAADLQRVMPLIAWLFFTGFVVGAGLVGVLWAWRSGAL